VPRERVVEPIANRALEGLMQNPSPGDAIELAQFFFERGDIIRRPLSGLRGVDAAELRDVEQRPCALGNRGPRRYGEPVPKPAA